MREFCRTSQGPLARLICVASAAMAMSAAGLAGEPYVEPGQIDRLIEQFTGQRAGLPGGARATVDPRLRLRTCTQPLSLAWHGTPGRSITVSCPDQRGWRLFVNVLSKADHDLEPGASVKRGETVTVAVRGRGFSVQRQGEAQGTGTVGQWIAVRIDGRGDPVRARIERPGLVVIPFGAAP